MLHKNEYAFSLVMFLVEDWPQSPMDLVIVVQERDLKKITGKVSAGHSFY